ncbi:MAG: aldo/keto reductase, partial [Oscillospiraceae bacterium]|nr:aldo/keto reductase [Oscillospiraceae bacterium]
ILEWIDANKKNGRIRNIGFSYHGNSDNFIKILDAYDWDMCQIQYNYLDVDTQAGTRGLHAAAAKGIPVVIMEPLRGGKLVDMLPEAAKRAIADSGCGYTPAELAFRWLWDQPEITCVPSGMNSVDMVQENCRVASEVKERSFTEEQFALIDRIRSMIESTTKVGCTGCGYCLPCPKGVKIPDIFRCYNRMYTENKGSGRFEYAQAVSMAKDPGFATSCVECGKCEQHCPQGIAIRQELKAADKALRPFPYDIAVDIARRFLLK